MNLSFSEILSKTENAYYPLRLIASDFFVPYWNAFTQEIPEQYIPIIQKAARECVEYFMNGEEIYWHINFEEKNALNTWRLFEKLTLPLPSDIQILTRSLALQLAVSPEESDSADYFLNLLTRLRFDSEYRKSLNYSDKDADVLNAAYEYNSEDLIDLGGLKEGWLASQSEWDIKLKAQTPDLPESVYVIFSFAYNPKSNLPLVHDNLHAILDEPGEYQNFIDGLENAFKKSLGHNPDIRFPQLLKI